MLANADFRELYPEFTDPSKYSDFAITTWLNLAYSLLDPNRWGTVLDYGAGLFTAHYLTVNRRNQMAARGRGIPGATPGVMTSKQVDKTQAGYDVKSTTFENAPFWNQTSYGVQLYQYIMMMGAGGIQSTSCGPLDAADVYGSYGDGYF